MNKKIIPFIIMLSFKICIGAEISHYNESKDMLVYSDKGRKDLKPMNFVLNLKEVLTKKDPLYTTIKNNIRNYEQAIEEKNNLAIKYETAPDKEGGKLVIEDKYLIKDPKHLYTVGGILSAIIFAPIILEIFYIMDFINGEEDPSEEDPFFDPEEQEKKENRRNERLKDIGRYTFIPGITVLAVGYFGSTIKIGEKERILTEEELLHPKLDKYFKENELDMAIDIYNKHIKL